MKTFARLFSMFVLFAACDGDNRLRRSDVPDYFPLMTGAYQIYDVREKRYYASASVEDLHYQLRAEVIDSFPSPDNTYTYVIHRSTRTGEGPWQSIGTWSVRTGGNEFVVSEGTTPYVRLRIPYYSVNRWDGNAYNTLGADEYAYAAIGSPYTANGITFENTVQVQQEFNQDPIVYWDERKEIYAAGVGLIYKGVTQLHYCTDDACLGQQKIDEGTEMEMVITEYGKM